MQTDSTIINQLIEIANNTEPQRIFFWDATATVVGNLIMLILTGIIIYLTIRDRQKAKSLNELQEQTESLRNSFIELLKPTWTILQPERGSWGYFAFPIQNIGGSCKDFFLEPIDSGFLIKNLHSIYGESYASSAQINCIIQHGTEGSESQFIYDQKYKIRCRFKDIEGREYEQILVLMKIRTAYPNSVHFTPPVRRV